MCYGAMLSLVIRNDRLFPEDLSKFCPAMSTLLAQSNSQNIANVLWSYAKLGYRNDSLFPEDLSKFCPAMSTLLAQGNSQEIANVLWSMLSLVIEMIVCSRKIYQSFVQQ